MVKQYSVPQPLKMATRNWPNNEIMKSPAWCAVDLRDGNQALPNPLTPQQKLSYFKLLVKLGFKEIEIGFPSASNDDFQFCRDLIEQDIIPDDVIISVLTQAREHLITRTMEALKGVKRAVCHVYIATSELHMKFVFGKSEEQTMATIVESVGQIRKLADSMVDSEIGLEFSPEEFTDTNMDFAIKICDKVIETWQPAVEEKVIINLPATVERRPPHHYADMIEDFCRKQKYRDKSIISIHSHNDMGCAVASSQMALMAGADRVEGTLFGHGERSGNVDLVTIIMNLQYLGIMTGIDFSEIEKVRDEIVELTSMPVNARHPYAGELVFSAFSGSHQDAIHKGLIRRDELAEHFSGWKIPYLHIDPSDIGRTFEKFIRINSQSGKGGIAHVLQLEHGINIPRNMLINLSRKVQVYADKVSRELKSSEVWGIFKKSYVSVDGTLKLINYWPHPDKDNPARIEGVAIVKYEGVEYKLTGTGSGPISAFVNIIKQLPIPMFNFENYEEDAIGKTADAEAVTFVQVDDACGKSYFGAGFNSNIDQAAVFSIISSLNNLIRK